MMRKIILKVCYILKRNNFSALKREQSFDCVYNIKFIYVLSADYT